MVERNDASVVGKDDGVVLQIREIVGAKDAQQRLHEGRQAGAAALRYALQQSRLRVSML